MSDNGVKQIEIAKDFAPERLDAGFSLADKMTPARDQNPLGTCASFGALSCLEFFAQKHLSAACLTDETERELGDCLGGLGTGEVMVAARDRGTVEEQYWKYDRRQICWTNPSPPDVSGRPRFRFDDVWLVWATDHRTPQLAMSEVVLAGGNLEPALKQSRTLVGNKELGRDPVESIKSTLSQYLAPVCVGVPVFFTDEEPFLDAGWESGPDIRMPTPVALARWLEVTATASELRSDGSGWHCIAVCGYDDTTQRLEFKNSWGDWWGQRGFGTIPYDYIRLYCRDAFIGTVER